MKQEISVNKDIVKSTTRHNSSYAGVLATLLKDVEIPCKFIFSTGEILSIGEEKPKFTVTFHSDNIFKQKLNEFTFGQAYVEGDIDIEGDIHSLFALRPAVNLGKKGNLALLFRFWHLLLLRNPISFNKTLIDKHYSYGDQFYLSYLDQKYHLYSQCLFESDDEPLEVAAERKMETIWNSLELKPGMRLLDIGGGWGAVTRYCAPRDVHVTALTIADDSFSLHNNLIEENNYTHCRVLKEDFLGHKPEEPYDAIVICGVIEHLPNYRQFSQQVWGCLKIDGRIYLDASAEVEKYNVDDFVRKYLYPGTHTYLCLQDLVQEFLLYGFEVMDVTDETHDYYLTMLHWAQRFENNREEIEEEWGQHAFRAVRMYLWGGEYSLQTRLLQAYHVVGRKTENPGIRPSLPKRFKYFLHSLR